MNGMKKGGMALVLVSGIVETVVSFSAYWVFYAISKSNADVTILTPMVILLSGLLGGILAIIGAVLIKNTRIGGAILSMVAAGLELFATLFLIVQSSLTTMGDAAMIILPFFILPNALAIAGATMALIPQKDQTVSAEPKAEEPKVEQ